MSESKSGFGHSAEANDELIRTPDFTLKDALSIPDPPSVYVCDKCGFEVEKSSDTLGSKHCGQPMRDFQKRKATDENLLRKILDDYRRSQG